MNTFYKYVMLSLALVVTIQNTLCSQSLIEDSKSNERREKAIQPRTTTIEGYLEVYHPWDVTSTYFGHIAGENSFANSLMHNLFVGYAAGEANTEGSFNTFLGSKTGFNNVDGHSNTFVGHQAGLANLGGNFNSFFGQDSGQTNETGSHITLIGSSTKVNTDGLAYATAIGAGTTVNNSNTVKLGRAAETVIAPGRVVIGQNGPALPNPQVRLLVKSTDFPTLTIEATDNTDPKIQLANSDTSAIGADSDWTIRMDISDPLNTLEWRYDNVPMMWLRNNGLLGLAQLANTGGNVDLCWNNTNKLIAQCTNSLRHKKKVQNYNSGLSVLSQLRPVSYIWKSSDQKDLGFIAEEIAKLDERLITRNNSGQVEGVKYDRLTAILVNAIKEQQGMIEELEKKVVIYANLEKRMEQIEFLISSELSFDFQKTEK